MMESPGSEIGEGVQRGSPRCEGLKTKGQGRGQQTGHLRGPDEDSRDGCGRTTM